VTLRSGKRNKHCYLSKNTTQTAAYMAELITCTTGETHRLRLANPFLPVPGRYAFDAPQGSGEHRRDSSPGASAKLVA
jgi:hypothetical protein